ncbi:glutamate racemase [Saccharothrix yanglingensis]|uniref:Glutamate racemase n=1 Tax=Saccharothrix yanglingensis TaxID=659496 RepID=A0ABU0X3W5_9PSEU|nr:glutamate racemase [Saccharothrix yanglingensis]MDQ2586809.1 glutamate racemase [Saccharothrix yanglingensis]
MVADDEAPVVAVIAGTPYDSGLGAELLRARGIGASAHAMARTPDEQDAMQYQDPGGLAAAFHARVGALRESGTELVMLFCNSLSAVVDSDGAALPVISPVTVYGDLTSLRSSLAVTGNAHAVVGVERAVRSANPDHRVLGVSDPALVRGIEAGDPEAAFEASHLPTTLRLAERLGLEAVVLACTHFTAVLPFVTAVSPLPVVDVGTRLVELTEQALATRPPTTPENHG